MADLRKKERIRVLVADDQPHILEAVELLLEPQGIHVECVRSPQLLLEALGQSDYDVLLIDLNYTRDTTSGKEGLDLLARLQEIDPRKSQVVEMRYFAGLSIEETADALGVSVITVNRDWRLARTWLIREINGERS